MTVICLTLSIPCSFLHVKQYLLVEKLSIYEQVPVSMVLSQLPIQVGLKKTNVLNLPSLSSDDHFIAVSAKLFKAENAAVRARSVVALVHKIT